MKNNLLILLLWLCSAAFVQAQGTKTIIKGKVTNAKDKEVIAEIWRNPAVYSQESVSGTIQADGSFRIEFNLSHGLEAVRINGTELYIAPGDELTLSFDASKAAEYMKFTGHKAVENNFMVQYGSMAGMNTMRAYISRVETAKSPAEYYAFVDSIRDAHYRGFSSYKANHTVPEAFEQSVKWRIDYTALYRKHNYYMMRDYYAKDKTLSLEDWSFMDSAKVQEPLAMGIFQYRSFLEDVVNHHFRNLQKRIRPDAKEFKYGNARYQLIDMFVQGQPKEYLLASLTNEALQFTSFAEAEPLYKDFVSRFPQSIFLPELESVYNKVLSLSPGKPAPGFTLTDLNGNKVSLTDFKGKVVYMDIWASWCGPCIAEIPHAKKLKEKFEGKDVVFLYVSIDETEEPWKKMIESKEMQGVHLISLEGGKGWNSLIGRLYGVSGVPTYYLIGKDGNILNNRPPRPSQAEAIEKALNEALAAQ